MKRDTAFRICAIALAAGLLSGCASEFSQFKRVHALGEKYSEQWSAREADYRSMSGGEERKSAAVGKAATAESTGSDNRELTAAFNEGRLSILTEYNQLRKTASVQSVAENWLRERFQKEMTSISAIREKHGAGAEDKLDTRTLPMTDQRAIHGHLGSVREIVLISTELNRYRAEYNVAYRKDKSEWKPREPMSPAAVNAIIQGVTLGTRAAHGR